MLPEREGCAGWPGHLETEVLVKAVKLHKEISTSKGTFLDAQMTFFTRGATFHNHVHQVAMIANTSTTVDDEQKIGQSRNTEKPCIIVTANEVDESRQEEEATTFVNDCDTFICVNLVDDTPAVVSLGTLCEDMGFSYS